MDRRRLLQSGLALTASSAMGWARGGQARAVGTVTATVISSNGLNLRQNGSPDAPIVNVLAPGAVLELAGPAVGGWQPVQIGSESGWVDRSYLDYSLQPDSSTAPVTAMAAGQRATVAADQLNVRGGPDTEEPIVGSLTNGAVVDLLAPSADHLWWRIAADSAVGYVDSQYLTAAPGAAQTGVFDLDRTLPYYRQLTPIWCDPADLEMWLEYHGQTLGPSYAAQQAFWSWELAHNAGFTVDQWDCSPYAVASAAHQWLPSLGFNHFIYDDPMAGTRLMAWLLANPTYREPSVATIWRGDHYILVRGVRAIGNPFQDPANAKILGLYVADPNKGRPSWLGQDRFVTLDRWLSELYTPITYQTPGAGVPGDVWQGKYVSMQRDWTTSGPSLDGRKNAVFGSYK